MYLIQCLILDLSGGVRFGPDVEWLQVDTDADSLRYAVSSERADSFYASIRQYWPDLEAESLVPDYSGVRPKLSHPSINASGSFQDFLLVGPAKHGVQGLVHMFGIESPGLTSSLSISNYVMKMLADD